ncbi:AAA domain-containing protein [Aromatoleum toluvorans]|uniref:AAA domain-containing protein n=1 Tax=Aromatoleum toluvorans TaxID=92002 RepID=A0ABX1Q3C3_9RHOO|nr:MoxR family ATPase [Aromatoleum toluvorans]NMG44975.1 AAA domain-containing protein [Aromatoleum toluvorans]
MKSTDAPAPIRPMTLADAFHTLRRTLEGAVLGQAVLVERLLVALLADGHLLVEGPPGVAKTRAAHALAALIDADFHRIQFTPDLLPADLTGSEIFRPQDGSFHFERGPLFHHLLLADEINRAPAKVQSALLEAMAERQVTIGQTTHTLPRLFLVIATQNPIEHEGTYPLPEAQLDRFLLHVRVGYPEATVERDILRLARAEARAGIASPASPALSPAITQEQVFAARRAVLDLHMSPNVEDYILRLVAATRTPEQYGPDLAGAVRFGASPRAGIALDRCARARAWLHGRDYVSPDDIQALAPDVLRHRILPGWEAIADGLTADTLTATLLERVPAP